MAPPPPASLPLTQRVMALARTLQFGWFVGHLLLLLSTIRYGLSYITFNTSSTWAKLSYRTAFLSAAATYGIVVYKALRAKQRAGRPSFGARDLAADENVQYLAMAIVWLFWKQVPLALLPFAIYSVFHYATYLRTNIIPTLQPPQQVGPSVGSSPSAKPQYKASPLADSIAQFVKANYDRSMYLVAALEIALWFRLFLSVLIFQKYAWLLLIIYTAFLRARYAQSTFVQSSVKELRVRIDSLVAGQGTPPVARQVWGYVKQGVAQFAEMTDLSKYSGGAAPVPKKAQ